MPAHDLDHVTIVRAYRQWVTENSERPSPEQIAAVLGCSLEELGPLWALAALPGYSRFKAPPLPPSRKPPPMTKREREAALARFREEVKAAEQERKARAKTKQAEKARQRAAQERARLASVDWTRLAREAKRAQAARKKTERARRKQQREREARRKSGVPGQRQALIDRVRQLAEAKSVTAEQLWTRLGVAPVPCTEAVRRATWVAEAIADFLHETRPRHRISPDFAAQISAEKVAHELQEYRVSGTYLRREATAQRYADYCELMLIHPHLGNTALAQLMDLSPGFVARMHACFCRAKRGRSEQLQAFAPAVRSELKRRGFSVPTVNASPCQATTEP